MSCPSGRFSHLPSRWPSSVEEEFAQLETGELSSTVSTPKILLPVGRTLISRHLYLWISSHPTCRYNIRPTAGRNTAGMALNNVLAVSDSHVRNEGTD